MSNEQKQLILSALKSTLTRTANNHLADYHEGASYKPSF